jgi:hypothetical protein
VVARRGGGERRGRAAGHEDKEQSQLMRRETWLLVHFSWAMRD